MNSQSVLIGPSVLAANFLRLGEQLNEIEHSGADYVHYDVMDGRFVPNIALGLQELESVRRGTALPIDVHLMIMDPDRWVGPFCEAGADAVTFHIEAAPHAIRVAQSITEQGKRAGIALNPGTPIAAVTELLPFVSQVLIMTVNPGFGGQSFISSMLDKVSRLRHVLDVVNPTCAIQVDGGINRTTAGAAVAAGATSLVAGTAAINDEGSIRENVAALRAAALAG